MYKYVYIQIISIDNAYLNVHYTEERHGGVNSALHNNQWWANYFYKVGGITLLLLLVKVTRCF
jgi:hypothetical protein